MSKLLTVFLPGTSNGSIDLESAVTVETLPLQKNSQTRLSNMKDHGDIEGLYIMLLLSL